MAEFHIQGYVPGAIGSITRLHAQYYSRHWGFGLYFEAKVAREMSEFLSRFDPAQDGFWTVCRKGTVEGGVAVDGIERATKGAHLRWFILSEHLHGQGFGNRLMRAAVSFCNQRSYSRIYLWTFEGLDAARHLYEKFGFQLVHRQRGDQWGTPVVEQKFVLKR